MGDILRRWDHIPPGFLEAGPRDLLDLLGGPSLICLEGRRPRPLFVSVLQHGNEYTGLQAAQRLLSHFGTRNLPRSLALFVGNVAAAAKGVRSLDGQPDFNRIWPGHGMAECPETAMAEGLVREMARRDVFASIDVHNNTGLNPHYACINRLDPQFLSLASLFGRTVVYFLRPRGVQSMAFAPVCPATTVECGKPGEEYGVRHAAEFLGAVLGLEAIPAQPADDCSLYHTVATVRVPDGVPFGFSPDGPGIRFLDDLDRFNFRELPEGTTLGRVPDGAVPLTVIGEQGEDLRDQYFRVCDGELMTTRRVMPSMLSLDAEVVRQDCLCYLMERIRPPAVPSRS